MKKNANIMTAIVDFFAHAGDERFLLMVEASNSFLSRSLPGIPGI